ncbi:hypothetical protein AcV5_005336 [Taiwanofungus camphoratus]|nr:hypothetical protein AcV5_005336 [Antrodia cinnamomea]
MTNDPKTPSRPTNEPSRQLSKSTNRKSTELKSIETQPAGIESLETPVATSSFYSSANTPLGSSHTGYIAPTPSPYREPQLVQEDPIPELAPSTGSKSWLDNGAWGDTGQTPWDQHVDSGWAGGMWGDTSTTRKVAIDGRDLDEELHWWDRTVREKCARPGPGILPPTLADALHDPDHALYSVSVSQPPPGTSPLAPTPDDVRTAIPHPNAYYCKEHNGWVLLLWRTSSVLPPLARTFESPLPDLARRKRTDSCVGDGEQPFGQANATHHWHRYERAVDARKLNPPFVHGEELLDLFVCCQCSKYCLVSQVIPGIIPAKLVDEFTRDKFAHPSPDRNAKASVLTGWETVVTIIENRLWKNEIRSLPVTRARFQSKVGWNSIVRQVFEAIDFPAVTAGNNSAEDFVLQPPETDPTKPMGKQIRAKLLRAWIEISAWLTIYQKSKDSLGGYNPQVLHVNVDGVREMYQTAIGAHVSQIPRGLLPASLVGDESLTEAWQTLGITPGSYSWELLAFTYLAQCRCDPTRTTDYFTCFFNIAKALMDRGDSAPQELQTLILEERTRGRYTHDDLNEAIKLLGFGKDAELGVELDSEVDDQFILEAWRSARRRAWRDTMQGTDSRRELNDALKIVADERGSEVLQKAYLEERGSGMSPETAYSTLDVPKDVDEGMLLTVYMMRVEDQPGQAEKMRDALTVISEVRDSERLRQFLITGRDPGDVTHQTSPDMPRGLNQLGNTCYLNSLLQYFYTIRDLREAIAPLANADAKSLDDSKFTDDDLKRHRVGGRLVTRREILRSKKFVNQLADLFWNLEYCEGSAVTPTVDLAKLALVTSQDEEEDDQDRTGTDSSNDTDATLVEDTPMRSTYGRRSPSPTVESPTESVLGKRYRDIGASMDIVNPTGDPDTSNIDAKPSSPYAAAPALHPHESVASSSKLGPAEQAPDFEMQDSSREAESELKVPPLPPRKPRQADDSIMMFGRQHDVAECMDNCMFQIETALLDFQEIAGAEDDKTSVVKRLFYGKKRQRLTPLTPSDDTRHKSSIHEKEDLFSHLHVNVSDEGFDLYDGLVRYFDDVVDLEGQKKRMEVSLVDLPPLLQIQLQRAQFDRETQQAYKSQAYVKFGETIYMDRFLDSSDPDKKARAKLIQSGLTACRDRIQRLTQDKHAPFAAALGNAADFLSKQNILQLPEADEDLISLLRSEEEVVTKQLEEERAKATQLKTQLEDVWKYDKIAVYELTSVFIHRGYSPSWGHYFFYSRNLPDKPDSWFKYNDSDVSVVSKDEVLADSTGSTANPYMLVFVRKGSEAIQTVHRFDPEKLQDG